jgi:erythronate-4-phosphate dehydrogenase
VTGLSILADENMRGVSQCFAGIGEVRLMPGRAIKSADLRGVDALLVRSVTRVDKSLLHGSGVRFVGTATSGVDHIDRSYLAAQGLGFAYAPGSNANSVVEYVLSTIAATDDHLERLLAGGVLGVVGYGHIGKALVSRLQALGVGYKVHDPWLAQSEIPGASTLAEVLACQVVSLHAELNRQQPWPSFHLLAGAQLKQLRSGQLLINVSRGSVVDSGALLARVESGDMPELVLDVWEGEPNFDTRLLPMLRYATAHIAGYSLDGKLLATRMLCDALCGHFNIEPRAVDEAVNGGPAVVLEEGLAGAALIRASLAVRYDIGYDDHALRALAGIDPARLGEAFDGLRRGYRERRELAGSAVAGRFSSEQAVLLQALGCRLTELEGQG